MAYIDTPIGKVQICASSKGITKVHIMDDGDNTHRSKSQGKGSEHITDCCHQLDEYFKGNRKSFNLSMDLDGTDFQKKVWAALQSVPYGETCSYGEIARYIGKPRAQRAVGSANHSNPVAIIVPCHRIIGSNGSLTGYGGGLWRKEWLLEHERANKSY